MSQAPTHPIGLVHVPTFTSNVGEYACLRNAYNNYSLSTMPQRNQNHVPNLPLDHKEWLTMVL